MINRRRFLKNAVAASWLSQAGLASGVTASFDKNGRAARVIAPGLGAFSSGFSASVQKNGNTRELSSRAGSVMPVEKATQSTPYGQAPLTVSRIQFPDEELELMLHLGQVPGGHGVLFQAGIRNAGRQTVKLSNLTPVQVPDAGEEPAAALTLDGNPEDWLITGLTGFFADQTGNRYVRTLKSLASPLAVMERGALYHRDGRGFLFGPAGEPVAYLRTTFRSGGDNRVAFQIVSEMSGIELDRGETRWGQQAVLLMEEAHAAIDRHTEWVARTHGARTAKGPLYGWCSWYLKTTKITGEDVLGIADAVLKNPDRLQVNALQIDDGYQDIDGKWDANEKFPQGMSYYAKRLAETGARPGLLMAITMIGRKAPWLQDPANMEAVWGKRFTKGSQFRLDESGFIDPTHPRAKAYIADRVRHAVESGFYLLEARFQQYRGRRLVRKEEDLVRDHAGSLRQHTQSRRRGHLHHDVHSPSGPCSGRACGRQPHRGRLAPRRGPQLHGPGVAVL